MYACVLTGRLQHIRGLYRGLGVSMVGSAPATCLYLTSYEVSKDYLHSVPLFRESPSLLYLGAGMLAEALSCVLWVPIDVIKERMQVQTQAVKGTERVYYRSTLHAFETIMKTEHLSGLYKGYTATLLSFGPFSALYFMLYEKVTARVCVEFVRCEAREHTDRSLASRCFAEQGARAKLSPDGAAPAAVHAHWSSSRRRNSILRDKPAGPRQAPSSGAFSYHDRSTGS